MTTKGSEVNWFDNVQQRLITDLPWVEHNLKGKGIHMPIPMPTKVPPYRRAVHDGL